MSRKFLVLMAAGLVFAGVGVSVVRAADAPAAPAPAKPAASSATGTWTWTMEGRNGGQAREMKLTLKQEGEKLTGSMPGRNAETPISDGTIKNGELSFKIVRSMNGNDMVTKYTGKLEGDVIKFKSEMDRNGTPQVREFEAKRAPADAAK